MELEPVEVPEKMRKFVTNDVVFFRIMDKVSSKPTRPKRLVVLTKDKMAICDENGCVKKFFKSKDLLGMKYQDVPRKGALERHVVISVEGGQDVALSQIEHEHNPKGSSQTDSEFITKLPIWVKTTANKELPVTQVGSDEPDIVENSVSSSPRRPRRPL